MTGEDSTQFYRRRRRIPKALRKKQLIVKAALRRALCQEVYDFRFDQTLDAMIAGDTKRADTYRRRLGRYYAYDVCHVTAFSVLIRDWMVLTNVCWEDCIHPAGKSMLVEPHLSNWASWHRRYSREQKNLFLQPRSVNLREPRILCALPSRGPYGPF